MQFPGPLPEWQPIDNSSQFLDVAVSTALTVPTAPVGGGASRAGIRYVALLMANGCAYWIREDGQAVTSSYAGGKKMLTGDWQIVYGLPAIKNLRVKSDAPGTGSLAVTYYWFR